MSRPAGLPGIFAASGMGTMSTATFQYGLPLGKATDLSEHALRRHSPYAEVSPTGWNAREAQVQPTYAVSAAGVVSAGSIDNTYLPRPLSNAWGKAREMAKNEYVKPPKVQATDLLIVAKGGIMPPPEKTLADLASVRPAYSKTIPFFHPVDPQRFESGFVRSPNVIPGAAPAPTSPMVGTGGIKTVPENHALLKLAFDQGMHGSGRSPVARVVNAEPERPTTAQPRFQSVPAGLPGGISLAAPSK